MDYYADAEQNQNRAKNTNKRRGIVAVVVAATIVASAILVLELTGPEPGPLGEGEATSTPTPTATYGLFTDHANCGNAIYMYERTGYAGDGNQTPLPTAAFSRDCLSWTGAVTPISHSGDPVATNGINWNEAINADANGVAGVNDRGPTNPTPCTTVTPTPIASPTPTATPACSYTFSEDAFAGPLKVVWADEMTCGDFPETGTAYLYDAAGTLLDTRPYASTNGLSWAALQWYNPGGTWGAVTPSPGKG